MKVISRARGYNYRINDDEQAFEIAIFWNSTDSFVFNIDSVAGFPGFETENTDIFTNFTQEIIISPAPFADGKIEIAYKIWD